LIAFLASKPNFGRANFSSAADLFGRIAQLLWLNLRISEAGTGKTEGDEMEMAVIVVPDQYSGHWAEKKSKPRPFRTKGSGTRKI